MDAKPQRPLRMLRIRNDENLAPEAPLAKTIHHRNKSSPALTMAVAGGTKAAVKRTAFGDVSNIVAVNRSSKDDLVLNNKAGTVNPLKGGNIIEAKKSTALLRPAQRPLSVSNLRSLLTGHNNPSSDSSAKTTSTVTATAQATRKTLTRRQTTIFKDSSLQPVLEHDVPPLPPAVLSISSNDAAPKIPVIVPPQSHLHLPPITTQPLKLQTAPLDEIVNAKPLVDSIPVVQPSKAFADSDSIAPAPPITVVNATAFQTYYTGPSDPHVPRPQKSMPIIASHDTAQKTQLSVIEALPAIPAVKAVHIPSSVSQAHLVQIQPAARPEPEEYWDEEEDEIYDEEGFVTARSFRSKGDSTTGAVTAVLFPQANQKSRRELLAARDLVEATRTADEIEDESYDTSMVAEYGEEIFDYMRQLEVKMLPNAHYMENQHEIQWSTRAVLMDWLVQVHHRFDLLPETLFLCVNYIDRFLSCKVVSLGKLQLVGATAIFIAAKYEEINCPSIQEIVYMVDGGYTVDEILKAERFMLTMLQFELGWPGPMSFLRRISKADDYDLETRTLAKYFLEVTLMDDRFIGSPPSFLAAASHCLARMMLRKGIWTSHHVHYSGYTYSQLRPLVKVLMECCEQPRKHHSAVYNKYCDKRYKRASAFVEAEMQRGFQLPDVPPTNHTKTYLQSQAVTYYDSVSFFR